MESTSLQSLQFHDPGRYVLAFKIASAREAKFGTFAEWVDSKFREVVVAELLAKLDEQEQLRVLGVGSGSGEKECVMLEKLLQRFPRINNRVVDLIHDQIVQYQALAQRKAHELHGVSFDWRQQTIEQYKMAGDWTKFHFINAVHCLYHVDNVDSSLTYLYDHLEPGGILLIAHMSDKCDWNHFWERFLYFKGKHYRSLADIRSFLDHRSIPYTQYHQKSRVNIAECFDEASEDGRLMVDFITCVANFQETASEDLQKSIMEYLANSCDKNGDEMWFSNDWNTIIISKPLE